MRARIRQHRIGLYASGTGFLSFAYHGAEIRRTTIVQAWYLAMKDEPSIPKIATLDQFHVRDCMLQKHGFGCDIAVLKRSHTSNYAS